jgi:hypothetical protein
MARMLSQIATTIRGSIGGCVFTANPFQSIVVRKRVSPVNPQTPAQSAIRLAMSAANEQWDQLSDADRQAWEDYAQSVTFSGPMGSYTVPGRQMALGQQALAYYLSYQGNSDFDVPAMDPPTKLGLLGIGPIIPAVLGAAGTGFQFSITNPNTEDITCGLWISHRQNDSRLRFKGPWYDPYFHNDEVPGSSAGNVVVDDLPADGIYFVRIKAISTNSPRRLSPSAIYRCEATTVV